MRTEQQNRLGSQFAKKKTTLYLDIIFNIFNHQGSNSQLRWQNCSWLYLSAVSRPGIQDRDFLMLPHCCRRMTTQPSLIRVLTNKHTSSSSFLKSSLFDFDRNPKFTHKVKVPERERNTTSLRPACCNIFHSRSFYVGFKHAISQFNPIFPAFGALQWNRFHLILNIWSPFPRETPQQRQFFVCALFFPFFFFF